MFFYVFAKQIALENDAFLPISHVHFFTFQNTLVELYIRPWL